MPPKNPTAPPLYPELPTTHDEGMNFRLKRISDIRDFLEKELESRGRYRRRYKSIYNSAVYVNAGAGLISVCTGTSAVATLATGIGVVVSLPLGGIAAVAGVLSIIGTGISKLVLKKVEKHEQIKFIAMSKLSSVNGLVSKALQDGNINNEEYQMILQEMESYREHKSQIRSKIRADIKEMTTEREQEIREEAEKKGVLKGQEMAMKNLQTMMNAGAATSQ